MSQSAKTKNEFFTLPFSKLDTFLKAVVAGNQKLIAPIKTDLVRYQLVADPRKINLAEQPYFPVKEYFFHKHETLFEYKNGRIQLPEATARKRIFFGLRRCDLNGIAHQDKVFLEGKYVDPYYAVQREKSILIGYHCNKPPSKWCFCGSMDLADYYDLMFFRRIKHYLVHVGSPAGRQFIKPHLGLFKAVNYQLTDMDRKIPGTNLLKKKDIADYYDHPDWQKGVDQCISCSACTALCPTCYCFEPKEEPSITERGAGKRVRQWSSCQLKSFTRVAGGYVFRDKRIERFKHRIYHQLQYFREQNGIDLCVGCGRCISGCPTRIDFIKIINQMKPLKKEKPFCGSKDCKCKTNQ